ncbi:hypothetical protein TSAR_000207 [Trichomalopsis sarcophagae]|uniref:Uncharacterized protein n=1 Tax=Trichomalopsis sarcophagae TaxID=543379 RepID=A0A232FD94_9HYME|nr:hypothetical protein TSAR_000207 [Trichomalopsis sarcophagae]
MDKEKEEREKLIEYWEQRYIGLEEKTDRKVEEGIECKEARQREEEEREMEKKEWKTRFEQERKERKEEEDKRGRKKGSRGT